MIVVQDGDDAPTQRLLADTRVPYHLKVEQQPHSGASAARNRGAQAAAAGLLLFLDDDVELNAGALSSHLRAQAGQGDIVGIGRVDLEPTPTADGFALWRVRTWTRHFDTIGVRRPVSYRDCWSANLCVPRDIFLEVGGFAVDLPRSQDVELGFRLAAAGSRFEVVHEAHGAHPFPDDFDEIATDIESRGTLALELYRRHPPMLADTELGGFVESGRLERSLRRLLLLIRIGTRPLRAVSPWVAHRVGDDRWYSFLYIYFYWRGVRRSTGRGELWQRLTSGSTILVYHAVGVADERPSRFVVPIARFRRQVAWLARRRNVIDLHELVRHRRDLTLPPARSVVLTFDDGFEDNATLAATALAEHELPATFFLITQRMGEPARFTDVPELARRRVMGWDDVSRLRNSPITFGAHTRTHPALPELEPKRAQLEVEGSRQDLERELGQPAATFAYPFGGYDARIAEMVADAGYDAACTMAQGVNGPQTPIHELRRIDIRGTYSFARFLLILAIGDTKGLANRIRRRR